ncbi:P1 family peptidase [Sporosarcina ureae]|uniref:P1 family peptidase n=1 Tax=Sporosarcina ureae TaxID=1571 RepID=UPI0035E46421
MNFYESKKVKNRGIIIGRLPMGIKNCIADVKGVKVGHVTLDHPLQGDDYVATGMTAILRHGDNLFMNKVVGTSYTLNGFGKTTGLFK